MTEKQEESPELPETKTNWKGIYLLVLGFFLAFCLFMYLFTEVTSA